LQRSGGHADDLGDLVSALSPLDEVADLLHPFRSKLRWPSTMIEGLQFELIGLDHCFSYFRSTAPPKCGLICDYAWRGETPLGIRKVDKLFLSHDHSAIAKCGKAQLVTTIANDSWNDRLSLE